MQLEQFGYPQELKRVLGFFASFALQFSLICVSGAIFLLYNYGLTTAGPALFFWAWVVGGTLQMTVGLSIAELASAFPLAGSCYNWMRRLYNDSLAWLTGYILIIAHVAAMAGGDYGIAPYFLTFAGVANPTNLQIVAVALACLAVQTGLNIFSVKLSALVNNVGVVAELIGMSSTIILLTILGLRQGPAILTTTAATMSHGSVLPFLLVLLVPAWVISSFDSTGNISEELKDPRLSAPRGAMVANLSALVYGTLIVAIPLLAMTNLAKTTGAPLPLIYIMQTRMGFALATVFEAIILTSLFVNSLVLQLTAARIMWGQARDGAMPAARWLYKLNGGGVPQNASILCAAIAAVFCLWSGALSVIVALGALAWAVPYGLTVAVSLYAKLRGRLPRDRGWNLGKWGIANDIVALLWSIALVALLPLANAAQVLGGFAAVVVVGLLLYYLWVKPRWSPPPLPLQGSRPPV